MKNNDNTKSLEEGKKKPQTNMASTMKRLLGYVFYKNKLRLILIILGIIISSVGSMAVPVAMKILLDDFITPLIGRREQDFSGFYSVLLVLGIVFVISIIASYVYHRLTVTVGQGVLKRLRDEMFEKMQTLPISYFDKAVSGSVMSLYTNDTDAMRQMIVDSLPLLLYSAIELASTLTVMIILSPLLSILTFIVMAVMLMVTRLISTRSSKVFRGLQERKADITGYVEERISGQRVIKLFGYEKRTIEEFERLNEELFNSTKTSAQMSGTVAPIISNIGNIFFVLTAITGGALAINNIGGVSIGVLIAYMHLAKTFTQPFMDVAHQMTAIMMSMAGADRIFKLLDEKSEADEGDVELINAEYENGILTESKTKTGIWAWKRKNGEGQAEYIRLTGDIVIENMSFGYLKDKPVLKNISLYAKPGQKIALVGATGAGKTTITNLINRFYDIDEGRISYDGINISRIKKESIRRSLGIVLQDTFLFTDTIMENIRYGRLDATDEEVIEAAVLANADGFINMLPEGYATVLTGAGDELSVGQKQLLSIARAALSDPPVLILDEATSSIDTRTEAIVQRAMDNLMQGRTVIVIAHRLSTIRNSDAIIMLEAGEIIERGSHDELIEKRGAYYRLYNGLSELS